MPGSTPSYTGLSSVDVREREARGETNAYTPRVGRTYWDIVRDNLLNLFNIVLFTLLLVVLLFHDYSTVFFAGFSVVTNSLMGMFQEIAARRKLDQMAALAVKEARVYRDGELRNLPIQQIVRDDVIAIAPGERMVVDGKVLRADSLEMDESQLTGESDPVLKNDGDDVHSGTFCLAGAGVVVATQVGRDSTINKLSNLAKAYKNVQTPTQQKITTLVQITVVIMAVVGPMIFISGMINHLPTLEMFRNAVVFVTSLVPQGLVLTAILALTIGAVSMTRYQALIQRVNAVESMANVTVLCFDKTGTLTRNQLAVQEIRPLDGLDQAALNDLLRTYVGNLAHLNGTAAAMDSYLSKGGEARKPVETKLREVPFTSARKWAAIVLKDQTLVLGAPERVLDESDAAQRSIAAQAKELAAQGLRVLAFARTAALEHDAHLDGQRTPLALVILSDQIRENIQETLQMFREQNVALKVISGDNVETVRAIAGAAGMDVSVAYTGDQLEAMSDADFSTAADEAGIFARIEPDTKRRLIAALQARGHYVAMTGDGVNDVPALKQANLAIVMNDGAQISKDVGDIVLLNNAMSTLPLAFREGRAITQTIFGTSKMFLVKNFYSLLFFIFAGFMAMPFPINPTQISWITFGIINVPATLIAFRVLKPAYMQRFRQDVLDYVITAGFIGAVAMSILYAVIYVGTGHHMETARSAITLFLTLFGLQVLLNTQGIEWTRPATIAQHKGMFALGIVLTVVTVAVPYLLPDVLPNVARSFRFVPPSPLMLLLIVALFLLSSLVIEVAARTRALVSRIWALAAP